MINKKIKIILMSFLALTLSSFTSTLMASEIVAMNIENSGSRLRTTVEGRVSVSHFTLEKPNRAIIDFKNTKNKAKFPTVDSNAISSKVRGGQRSSGYRVVVDLKQAVGVNVSESYDKGANKTYVILDMIPLRKTSSSSKTASTKVTKKTKEVNSRAKKTSASNKKRVVLIAIDAGHGGKDPGAISPSGIREKDIVLSIAKKLEKLIDNEAGFYSKTIRRKDVFIDLKSRSDVAREKKADLFISLHADAFPDERVDGASVYVLSHKGASSATAKFLAKKENEVDKLGHASLSGADALLKEVLVDLSMNDKLSESISIGKTILNSMGKVTDLHSNRVEKAAFVVLKTPDVPSVLIETGFISNQQEARKLSDPVFQEKMAQAIFKGVKDYFYKYPPDDSYIAWKKK